MEDTHLRKLLEASEDVLRRSRRVVEQAGAQCEMCDTLIEQSARLIEYNKALLAQRPTVPGGTDEEKGVRYKASGK